ncbi:MAG: serine/threonine-protein kinase [Fuerstiella sp.]
MSDEETDFVLQGFPQHSDDVDLRARQPVEILATQFVEELRAGKRPSVESYAQKFPVHAATIRESFPVLALLEQTRIQTEAAAFRTNMPEKFPFKKLGRCELLCEIGRGGMGVVFQAREVDSNHIVAVKLLPWRVSVVPEWQKRFEEEARTTAKLRHRNIVPVFRFGQEHGFCYFVMQFVNGIGLDVIIRRLREVDGVLYQDEIERMESAKPAGFVSSVAMTAIRPETDIDNIEEPRRKRLTRTSWKSFTQIAIQTAQALRHAHNEGILHNDIKPGNVLLDGGGRVWITDFGLSQPINSNGSETARVMGTLRYMAPERLLGSHDARSDIYSLGITLYELLTLRPAFAAGNEDDMMSQILDKTPVPPREIEKQIPKGLGTIVLNCISPNPMHRYPHAEALLTDLLKFSNDQKVASLRPSRLANFVSRMKGEEKAPRLRDYFDEQ